MSQIPTKEGQSFTTQIIAGDPYKDTFYNGGSDFSEGRSQLTEKTKRPLLMKTDMKKKKKNSGIRTEKSKGKGGSAGLEDYDEVNADDSFNERYHNQSPIRIGEDIDPQSFDAGVPLDLTQNMLGGNEMADEMLYATNLMDDDQDDLFDKPMEGDGEVLISFSTRGVQSHKQEISSGGKAFLNERDEGVGVEARNNLCVMGASGGRKIRSRMNSRNPSPSKPRREGKAKMQFDLVRGVTKGKNSIDLPRNSGVLCTNAKRPKTSRHGQKKGQFSNALGEFARKGSGKIQNRRMGQRSLSNAGPALRNKSTVKVGQNKNYKKHKRRGTQGVKFSQEPESIKNYKTSKRSVGNVKGRFTLSRGLKEGDQEKSGGGYEEGFHKERRRAATHRPGKFVEGVGARRNQFGKSPQLGEGGRPRNSNYMKTQFQSTNPHVMGSSKKILGPGGFKGKKYETGKPGGQFGLHSSMTFTKFDKIQGWDFEFFLGWLEISCGI